MCLFTECFFLFFKNCFYFQYIVILSTLLIVQFGIGITAFVYRNNIEDSLDSVISQTFQNDDTKDIVDEIQIDVSITYIYLFIFFNFINIAFLHYI